MNVRKIVKTFIPTKLFSAIEPYGHLVEAVVLNVIYGFPAKNLKIIGVTGTNGKTTTSFLIHNMLVEAGYKTGIMTTVAFGVNRDLKPQVEHMTTVSVPVLLKRFKEMKASQVDWLVLETTSHALAQHRVWGVPYNIAVMTNITHEHLDYHQTFKRYLEAKKMLFKMANANKNGLQAGVVNADDSNANEFIAVISNPVTYGVEQGDLRAKDVKLTSSGCEYTAVAGDDSYSIKCQLPGSFNIHNSLAALAVGRILELSREQIEQGIGNLESVEGRMTSVDAGQPFSVIVDFAHTPDSFEKIFKDLRPIVKGKLIAMFGSAGRRDEAKRPIMGGIAGKYADEVVLTEEDDRDVPGMEIIEQIAAGAEKAGKARDKDLFIVHDREEAIKFAISRASSKEDTVILLGKGHEKTIARAHGDDPWDEVNIASRFLNSI